MIRLIKSLEAGRELFAASQDLLEEASVKAWSWTIRRYDKGTTHSQA
jgi:hypothetical protein